MLARLRGARLLGPTVASLIGALVLVGLGSWQLERRQWKEGLLAKIAARVGAAPLPLLEAEARLRAGEDIEYLHIVATGRFHNDQECYLYAPEPSGPGWHVYTPLELSGARQDANGLLPPRVLLIVASIRLELQRLLQRYDNTL